MCPCVFVCVCVFYYMCVSVLFLYNASENTAIFSTGFIDTIIRGQQKR